jgi:hypothetical protein
MRKSATLSLGRFRLSAFVALMLVLACARGAHATLTFGEPLTFDAGGDAQSAAIADFNGDQFPDLAVANTSSGTLLVVLGDGAGDMVASTTIKLAVPPRSVIAADFDNDNLADLAVAANDGTSGAILLLRGTGTGGFLPPTTIAAEGKPAQVIAADFNEDGNLDLSAAVQYVSASTTDVVQLLLGDGSGSFTRGQAVEVPSLFDFVVGDYNGDGHADIVTDRSLLIQVFANDGTGNFSEVSQTHVDLCCWISQWIDGIALADVDGNGSPDLIVHGNYCDGPWMCGSSYIALFNDGSGTLSETVPGNAAPPMHRGTPPVALPAVASPAVFAPLSWAADYEQDGRSDITLGNYYELLVLLGNGAGSFNHAVDLENTAGRAFAGDINQDGKPDVIWSGSWPQHTLSISINKLRCGNSDDCNVSYTIMVTAPPTEQGGVTGAGIYHYGQIAILKATPECGWKFAGWRDLEKNTTVSQSTVYRFVVRGDVMFQPIFELDKTVSLLPDLFGGISFVQATRHGRKYSLYGGFSRQETPTCTQRPSYKIGWYLSADEILSADDLKIYTRKIKRGYVWNFIDFSTRLPIEKVTSGSVLYAVIDGENRVIEANENNNVTSTTITFPAE